MFPNDMIDTFAPLIFLLAIAFVLVWPHVLMRLIGVLEKEKQRLATLLGIGIISMVFGTIGMVRSGSHPDLLTTGTILLSIATVSASAVTTASFLFRTRVAGKKKLCIAVGSLIQLPFLFALLVNPESWPGGPPLLFADRLPILGILLDTLAKVIGTAGETGYEAFFSFGLLIGLYLEVFLGVIIVYLVAEILIYSPGRDAPR